MKENNYVMSMFDIFFVEDGHFYICNTLRGGLHEVDQKTYELCVSSKIDPSEISKMSADLIENLSSAGYLVDYCSDAESINLLRYMKLIKSFQSDRLTLVIAPTLYCNFACPYCYEKNYRRNKKLSLSQVDKIFSL